MNNFETLTLYEKDITDFAEARNRLLKLANHDWVLFLDTDEEVTKELAREIKNLNSEDFNGFYLKRKIIFLGKCIGEDKVLRLGKKSAGKWERKIHEKWNIKGKTGTLENYIIHNTSGDINSYIRKMNTYSGIHAKENMREEKKTGIFKIILFPKMKFIQNLFLGRGFVFSMLQSFHSFLGWAKQWELQKD